MSSLTTPLEIVRHEVLLHYNYDMGLLEWTMIGCLSFTSEALRATCNAPPGANLRQQLPLVPNSQEQRVLYPVQVLCYGVLPSSNNYYLISTFREDVQDQPDTE